MQHRGYNEERTNKETLQRRAKRRAHHWQLTHSGIKGAEAIDHQVSELILEKKY